MSECAHQETRRFGPYRQPGTLQIVHVLWCHACGAVALDVDGKGVFMLPQSKPELKTIARKVAAAGVHRVSTEISRVFAGVVEKLLKPPMPRE